MPRQAPFLCLALLCVLGILGACGGDEPTTSQPPSIRFEPTERALTRGALQPVDLRVLVDDGSAVSASFSLDGVVVAEGASYTWPSDLPGSHQLTAVVQRDGQTYAATWVVEVSDTGSLPTPTVTQITASLGPLPGTCVVAWEAPPASQYTIPLQEYVVGISTSPIDSLSDASVQQVVVPHQGASIVHQLQRAGLQERARYFFRVLVRDTFGRESQLSPEASSEATGHYDVSGIVYGIRIGAAKAPLDEVLVAMGSDYKQFTGTDGLYALLNLPDTFESRLSLQDARQEFYSVIYPRLATVDQQQETLLFERGVVHVFDAMGDRDMSRLQFFKEFTNKHLANATPFYRWESYPVKVYTPPHMSGGVDYQQAFRDGIQNWNDATGETMLQAVDTFDEAVDVGAVFVESLPVAEHILGITDIAAPANAHLREVIPRLVRVQLTTFSSQAIANVIIAHELGHVLLLGHSPSQGHLMRSDLELITDTHPTPDEAYCARLVAHLPQGTAMANYSELPPGSPAAR